MKPLTDAQAAMIMESLNSKEGIAKLAEQSSRYVRGALAAQRELRFGIPGGHSGIPYFGFHTGDFSEEAVARQDAAEREIANEYRYAMYPLDSEKDRCYTCGGPTYRLHKCRGCRGEW